MTQGQRQRDRGETASGVATPAIWSQGTDYLATEECGSENTVVSVFHLSNGMLMFITTT